MTGKLLSDKGITEFVFKLGDGGLKVYSMKFPLIFGLSDASNVATGVLQSPSNEPTIVVDDSGNVAKEPFDQAVKTAMEEFTVESGSFILESTSSKQEGFVFANRRGNICWSSRYLYGDKFNVFKHWSYGCRSR